MEDIWARPGTRIGGKPRLERPYFTVITEPRCAAKATQTRNPDQSLTAHAPDPVEFPDFLGPRQTLLDDPEPRERRSAAAFVGEPGRSGVQRCRAFCSRTPPERSWTHTTDHPVEFGGGQESVADIIGPVLDYLCQAGPVRLPSDQGRGRGERAGRARGITVWEIESDQHSHPIGDLFNQEARNMLHTRLPAAMIRLTAVISPRGELTDPNRILRGSVRFQPVASAPVDKYIRVKQSSHDGSLF